MQKKTVSKQTASAIRKRAEDDGPLEMGLAKDGRGWYLDVHGCGLISGDSPGHLLAQLGEILKGVR